MHKELKKLEEMLLEEVDQIVHKGSISPLELDNVNKAVCVIEKIEKIRNEYMDENEEEILNKYALEHSKIQNGKRGNGYVYTSPYEVVPVDNGEEIMHHRDPRIEGTWWMNEKYPYSPREYNTEGLRHGWPISTKDMWVDTEGIVHAYDPNNVAHAMNESNTSSGMNQTSPASRAIK